MRRPVGAGAQAEHHEAGRQPALGEHLDGRASLLDVVRPVELGIAREHGRVAVGVPDAVRVEAQCRHAFRGPATRDLDPQAVGSGPALGPGIQQHGGKCSAALERLAQHAEQTPAGPVEEHGPLAQLNALVMQDHLVALLRRARARTDLRLVAASCIQLPLARCQP